VNVSSGVASVLTAATCCTTPPPTIAVMGNDYGAGEAYLANPPSAVARLPRAHFISKGRSKLQPGRDDARQ
jgi:hypothetical protein